MENRKNSANPKSQDMVTPSRAKGERTLEGVETRGDGKCRLNDPISLRLLRCAESVRYDTLELRMMT